MTESNRRRKFGREFKAEAVRLVTEGGRTVEDPAGSFPGKGRLKPQDEELARLQKELSAVREERDILKKALAIFSKHPK